MQWYFTQKMFAPFIRFKYQLDMYLGYLSINLSFHGDQCQFWWKMYLLLWYVLRKYTNILLTMIQDINQVPIMKTKISCRMLLPERLVIAILLSYWYWFSIWSHVHKMKIVVELQWDCRCQMYKDGSCEASVILTS